jgi:Cu+-exporting ATPase
VDDTVRETSQPAVARLKSLGLTPYLLSDDGDAHARSVAAAVGIDPGKVRSGPQPGTPDLVGELQRQGRRVAVIGRPQPDLLFDGSDLDGNDLDGKDLERAADTIALAQQTRAVIRQNVVWALGFDGVALAAAALGVVHPALAAALATLASFVPLANARRLSR